MESLSEPDKRLAIAALDVLLSVSEHNLAQGRTWTVRVTRESVRNLAAAMEVLHPGRLARAREIEAGLLPCGCPASEVQDIGHQEGCVELDPSKE